MRTQIFRRRPAGTPGRRRAAAGLLLGAAMTAVTLLAVSVTASSRTGDAGSTGSTGNARDTELTARPLTDRETALLDRAEQLLLRACMREHGFVYQPAQPHRATVPREFPYVIDDPRWAARHGYGTALRAELDEARRNDPNQRYFRSLPAQRRAAALRAANGEDPRGLTARTPDGLVLTRSADGCRSTAERELYGDLAAWFQARSTVESLDWMRRERVTADARYTAAVADWARCMRAAGHPHESPAALRAALPAPEHALPAADEFPAEEERALAVAEARCALDTGFADTARTLDAQHADELQRQHRSAVDTARRLQLAALPRAARITAQTADGR